MGRGGIRDLPAAFAGTLQRFTRALAAPPIVFSLFSRRFLGNAHRCQVDRATQGIGRFLVQLFPFAQGQTAGQEDRPVTDTLQAAYPPTLGFPQTAYFPVRSEEHTLNSSHVRISYAVF